MKGSKPSFEDIRDKLLPKCKEFYSPVFEKFQADERFYELAFKDDLNLPTQFKNDGIVLPTARDLVDVFVDHINISNARVFVNRKNTAKISAEEAEMLRKLFVGLIYQTNVESSISPWRVAAKHFALHGVAVFKDVWDADRWPDKPERNEGESEEGYTARIDEWRAETHQSLPVVIQAVNPNCVMPDPSYGGSQFVFEVHKRLVLNTLKRWPHWKNPNNRDVSEEVEYVSYWDDTYRCDFVDGEPVIRVPGGVAKHSYGFIPYVFIDSGLGNTSSEARPEMRYVGILRYVTDLLISESLNYSLNNILMKRETMKGGYITGADAKTIKSVKQEYGKYWPVGDKDVEFHDWETKMPPDGAYRHLALTSDYLAAHAAPRSLRGQAESGVRSGADRRVIIAEAMSKYRYSEDAFQHGTAKVLVNCARILKNIVPGDVRIWAKTPIDEFDVEIKKDKLKEPFTCHVEFAPISEEDEYRRHDDLERLLSAGITTKQWSRRQMSNVDSIALEREEIKEALRNSPAYKQVIEQYLATKAQEALSGLAPVPTTAGEMGFQLPLRKQGGGGEAGGGMVFPIPERAAPGSAEEQQLALKQLRSQTAISSTQGMGGGGARGANR